jgi:hypothetical protein
VKLAPFGVTTVNFGISCSRFDSSVLVLAKASRHCTRLLRDLAGFPYNSRLLLAKMQVASGEFYGAFVTKR